jgi:hypothetical protein
MDISKIANLTIDEQKQLIREQLYPIIQSIYSVNATTVTDRIMEIETAELIRLFQNPDVLRIKIEEVISISKNSQ